jgi:hypothetical protein
MNDRKQYLVESFKERYGEHPDEVFTDVEWDVEALERAISYKNEPLTLLGTIMKHEQDIKSLQEDKDHMSEETKEELRDIKSKHRLMKKMQCATYETDWSELRDLYVAGMYEELRDRYKENPDLDKMGEYEIEEL